MDPEKMFRDFVMVRHGNVAGNGVRPKIAGPRFLYPGKSFIAAKSVAWMLLAELTAHHSWSADEGTLIILTPNIFLVC